MYQETVYSIPQVGFGRGGYSGISQIYIGTPNQRGHGIGSFLGGLFRSVLPFLRSRAKLIGKEALKSGLSIADDVLDNGLSFKESARARLRESGLNLKRKATEKINNLISDSGYIPLGSTLNQQLLHDSRIENIRFQKRRKRFVKKAKKSKKQVRKGKKRKRKASKIRRKEVKRTKKIKKRVCKKLRPVADIFK